MEFDFSYHGSTSIQDSSSQTDMSFSPDVTREPTYFKGELRARIPFRETISALHDVVVSDMRYKVKTREEYMAWRSQQDEYDADKAIAMRSGIASEIESLQAEITELRARAQKRRGGFYKARQKYFNYLYRRDYDAWFVLDPVITVHPDECFFECFSQDESTYGRVGASYEVFQNIGEFACGTTNIDYSAKLYDEFQRIRNYKTTRFEIDPSGFELKTTGTASYKEVKIDLPDSWVRGFLQVSSAMSLPASRIVLHPLDMHNLLFFLKRNREKHGPRSLRFLLEPGKPVRILIEPFNHTLVCPRSRYEGTSHEEIRVWGRRRLHVLERLLPVARSFTIHLLGTGLPSFYVADCGDLSFTLGLSGWTRNDWSRAGNFDLMAPRASVDSLTQQRVFDALKENWREAPDALAKRIGLDRSVVLGALSAWTQAGRAIYDLNKQVYRVRELSRDPLPLDKLRFDNPREAAANQHVDSGRTRVSRSSADTRGRLSLGGEVSTSRGRFYPSLTIDGDERLVEAQCSCQWYRQNKLYKGPCEHILAIRIQFRKQKH